jgi:hypothetical protein
MECWAKTAMQHTLQHSKQTSSNGVLAQTAMQHALQHSN